MVILAYQFPEERRRSPSIQLIPTLSIWAPRKAVFGDRSTAARHGSTYLIVLTRWRLGPLRSRRLILRLFMLGRASRINRVIRFSGSDSIELTARIPRPVWWDRSILWLSQAAAAGPSLSMPSAVDLSVKYWCTRVIRPPSLCRRRQASADRATR